MKGGKYAKNLAKIQVRGVFRIRDIRRNVLPKFIQHCGRKPIETSVTEFCYKSVNLFVEEFIKIEVILFLIQELFR